eukprot:11565526-Alexandrium_andersonii.AAC.1
MTIRALTRSTGPRGIQSQFVCGHWGGGGLNVKELTGVTGVTGAGAGLLLSIRTMAKNEPGRLMKM